MKRKIIAGFLVGLIAVSHTFAYDLTDTDKTKGDMIAGKIEALISKKSEVKQEVFKDKIVTQLKRLQLKSVSCYAKRVNGILTNNCGDKNEKLGALVGHVIESLQNFYVAEKIKSDGSNNVDAKTSRYPGCDKDDIVLGSGLVWSACDIGSNISGKEGSAISWEVAFGGRDSFYEKVKTFGEEWKEVKTQGACKDGYHVPTETEIKASYVATKSGDTTKLFSMLALSKSQFYWVSKVNMVAVKSVSDLPGELSAGMWFGNTNTDTFSLGDANPPLRCLKN